MTLSRIISVLLLAMLAVLDLVVLIRLVLA